MRVILKSFYRVIKKEGGKVNGYYTTKSWTLEEWDI